MKSFLGRTDLPRGLRNNNPGNLIKTNSKWQGIIVPGSDLRFVQFENIYYGIRAKLYDIIGDITDRKQNTIRKLITAYAPPFENDTNAYINAVVKATGITADTPIPLTESFLVKLSKVIMDVENGRQYSNLITESDIKQAINMLPTSLKKKLLLGGLG